MKYSLIVDIGNSQIEIGLFDENKFVDSIRFDTNRLKSEYDDKPLRDLIHKLDVKQEDIEGGLIFSVVPHLSRLVQIIIKGETGVLLPLFDPSNLLEGLKANIDNPKEVGQDLLADIVGAIHFYGCPIVVTDLGTVTKNIVIDKDGIFQGVSFFPGVGLNAHALSERTAQLPELENIARPNCYYGKNTIDAMRSGIYYSHVASVKQFMEKVDEDSGYKFKKVITGGYSNIFKDDFKEKDYIVDPQLVLKGMHLIYKNQK